MQQTQKPKGKNLIAEVIHVKGACPAGHKTGDKFEIGVIDTGGLCGHFYHALHPYLFALFMGAKSLPPFSKIDENTYEFKCPDPRFELTLRVRLEDSH